MPSLRFKKNTADAFAGVGHFMSLTGATPCETYQTPISSSSTNIPNNIMSVFGTIFLLGQTPKHDSLVQPRSAMFLPEVADGTSSETCARCLGVLIFHFRQKLHRRAFARLPIHHNRQATLSFSHACATMNSQQSADPTRAFHCLILPYKHFHSSLPALQLTWHWRSAQCAWMLAQGPSQAFQYFLPPRSSKSAGSDSSRSANNLINFRPRSAWLSMRARSGHDVTLDLPTLLISELGQWICI
jgi:hypothetical protein